MRRPPEAVSNLTATVGRSEPGNFASAPRPAHGASTGAWRQTAAILLLAAVYFLAARLGLQLAFRNASVSPVWPPTGIGMAALLLGGTRLWPGIFMGAFAANWLNVGSPLVALGIAAGNTVESLLGVWLVRRHAGGQHVFRRPQDVFWFALLAAGLATMVSATIGVTCLALGGFAAWGDFGPVWSTWWLGDAVGALIVMPPLVLWSVQPRIAWQNERGLEAILLILTGILTAWIVVGHWGTPAGGTPSLGFLFIPVMVWTAFRFGRRGAATATLILAAIMVWGTLDGAGPFAGMRRNETLLALQAFVGMLAVTMLALAAVVREYQRGAAALAEANVDLERRIGERTRALSQAVLSLEGEIAEREQAELRLVESQRDLAHAQALAHIGSWTWDLETARIAWSEEMFRIHGLEPRDETFTPAAAFDHVHPDDVAHLDAALEQARRAGEPFALEHRIVRSDGTVRWLHVLGQAYPGDSGACRIQAVAHDVTERRLADTDRKRLEREILEVSNREQHRLGQDLHDDVGQFLTGIAFMSKTLEKKMVAAGRPEAETLAEIRSLVNQAIAKTRSLARVLSPVNLESGGFVAAIHELVAGAERVFDVACVLQADDLVSIDNHLAAVHLYRIVQEAISNAVRHGKADRIHIILEWHDGAVRVRIQDNGVGMPSDLDAHTGLGLRIMRYRAGLIGGTLEVSSDDNGTCVTCTAKGIATLQPRQESERRLPEPT